MFDGIWDDYKHEMIPVRNPATVAIQRTIAHCRYSVSEFSEFRYMCSGCLDRVLSEDY